MYLQIVECSGNICVALRNSWQMNVFAFSQLTRPWLIYLFQFVQPMSPSNSSSWPKAISFADCFSLSLAPSISPLFLHVTHLAKSAGPTTVTSFPNQLRWSLTSAANMCQGRLPAQLTLSLPLSLSLRLPLFSSISCVRAEWSGSQKKEFTQFHNLPQTTIRLESESPCARKAIN